MEQIFILKEKQVTSSHCGKPKEPLGEWSDAIPSSWTVLCPWHTISNKASSVELLLLMRKIDVSWSCRIILCVLIIVSGILQRSSSIRLTLLFDPRICRSSCLLTDSSTRAILTSNIDRTGLWSLSVTSMQASYLSDWIGQVFKFQGEKFPLTWSSSSVHWNFINKSHERPTSLVFEI